MSTESVQPVHPEPEHFPESFHEFDPELGEIVTVEQTGGMPPAAPAPVEDRAPHVEHSYQPARFTCVRCGSTNLARGYIVDYGDKFEQIHFAPKRVTLRWLNSILALRPWKSLAKLNAEACRDCGAVLMVVEPDELRRAERRRD
jgi:hypothetical protein